MWTRAACHTEANEQARLVEGKVCFISDSGSGGRGWGGQGRAAGVFSVDAPVECWLVAKLYCQIRLVFLFHSQYEAILIQVKKERKV